MYNDPMMDGGGGGDWWSQNAPQGNTLQQTPYQGPTGGPYQIPQLNPQQELSPGVTGSFYGVDGQGNLAPGYHWEWSGGVTGGKHPVPDPGTNLPSGTKWSNADGSPYTPPGGSASGQSGAPAGGGYNGDLEALKTQIRQSYTSRGLPVDESQVNYYAQKASKPDLYSDNQWRTGWNPYLEARMINGGDSADPRLAGTAGIVSAPAGYQPGGGQGGGYGGMWNTVPTADDASKFPGYQFAVQEGQKGIQQSAAARGTLLTGNTLKALSNYRTGAAMNQAYLPLANLNFQYNQGNAQNLAGLVGQGNQASSFGPNSPK